MAKELLLAGYKEPAVPSVLLGPVAQTWTELEITDIHRSLHHGVHATGEGHLFKNFIPLKASMHAKNSLSSRLFFGMRWSQVRNAYRYSGKDLRKSSPIDTGYWVTHNHSYNYYHWLIECLPKLVLIARLDPEARIILPRWAEPLRFVGDSLDALGLKNIQYVPVGESLKVDRLYSISDAILHREALLPVRDILRAWGENAQGPERVYISRNDARKRRVENEPEITKLLRDRGFHIVETAGMTLKQQVELFWNCKIFVSMHGAGLTNMLFMPQGGSVVEFRTYNEAFLPLAGLLGLKHYSVYSEKIGSKSAHHAHAIVDVGLVEQALDLIGDAQ